MKEDLQRIDALLVKLGLQDCKYLRQGLELMLEDKKKAGETAKAKK